MKRNTFFVALCALAVNAVHGQTTASSSDGSIVISPISVGLSGTTISNNTGRIVVNAATGSPTRGGVTDTSPTGVKLVHGYTGRLYDIRNFTISATPSTVDELETTQLEGGTARLDDSTFLNIAPGEIAWTILSGPIQGIDETGQATADSVTTDTLAVIEGAVLNFVDQLALTVKDVPQLTEFEQWQITHFGATDVPEAQPGEDPDSDGHDNEFEYLAGLDPNDPRSRFNLEIQAVEGEPYHRRLVFSPILPSRVYRVLFNHDISSSYTELAEPHSDTNGQRTVIDTNATIDRRFYIVEISKP